ncbi:hypothetical protein [Nocardia camponoti]|uniref:Low molecular weight antigen MTB12-like C-terminal domain-containing protein n=1 Tax=Nocardia camponoti TaxID=1616106 RepID=A0A917V506_9NOCA|nr:hypothetical protein [Nocardia camponoti]GGK37640.1 hypothetical protein GCM10011591_06570 [Nocardia camponoti]
MLPAFRRTFATACAALAVTAGVAACGSSDDDNNHTNHSSISATAPSNSSTSAAAAATAPTAEALQATLTQFSDPTIPTDAKTKLIVNGDARKGNIDKMNALLANYGTLSYAIANVNTNGTTTTADVTVTSPHGTPPAFPLTWEYVDGSWKISDVSGCLLMGLAQAPCVPQ